MFNLLKPSRRSITQWDKQMCKHCQHHLVPYRWLSFCHCIKVSIIKLTLETKGILAAYGPNKKSGKKKLSSLALNTLQRKRKVIFTNKHFHKGPCCCHSQLAMDSYGKMTPTFSWTRCLIITCPHLPPLFAKMPSDISTPLRAWSRTWHCAREPHGAQIRSNWTEQCLCLLSLKR